MLSYEGSAFAQSQTHDRMITRDGLDLLQKSLVELKKQREVTLAQVQSSAQDGDVKENSPLKAARERLSQIDTQLTEISSMVNNHIIPRLPDDQGTIRFGALVTVKKVTEKEETELTFRIGSKLESRLDENFLYFRAPLPTALNGCRVGSTVEISNTRYMVERVKYV